jgi:FdrA protein
VPVWNFVRKSFYQDSVTLMRLSRDLEAVEGVSLAAAMMGTGANLALLRAAGLLAADFETAEPADLVIAVSATGAAAAERARAAAEAALAAPRPRNAGAAATAPRTLASALQALPAATLALVSVPGAYAGAEAMKALRAGLHVMVFSDHVPVETEIALKRAALERGRFMLGPDCGTAIIDGVPLGFANVLPRGRVGIAAASGTGLQEVACLLAAAGEGVSQAIGVGGRDCSDAVGGLMMSRALAALGDDPDTRVVCLVGKPPAPAVTLRLAGEAARLGKPCVAHFTGGAVPGGAWHVAATLEDTALAAAALARGERPAPADFTAAAGDVARVVEESTAGLARGQRFVRGVYSGGTLAWEAVTILASALDQVTPGVAGGGDGHRVVDLGDDAFTAGRPHPMIDGRVRREWIEREGRDPGTAVLLLDVVLGHGAHADPVAELLPAIDAVRTATRVAVVASVCGTDRDPQNRATQVHALRARGVTVMPSNAQAARLAARIAARAGKADR